MNKRIHSFKELMLYYYDIMTRPLLVLAYNIASTIRCRHLPRKLSRSDLEKLKKLLAEEKRKNKK